MDCFRVNVWRQTSTITHNYYSDNEIVVGFLIASRKFGGNREGIIVGIGIF